MKISKEVNTRKLSLSEAIFQVVFLINNNRFESALEIVQINEILLSDLSQNKTINGLEQFREFVKNKFQGEKSS